MGKYDRRLDKLEAEQTADEQAQRLAFDMWLDGLSLGERMAYFGDVYPYYVEAGICPELPATPSEMMQRPAAERRKYANLMRESLERLGDATKRTREILARITAETWQKHAGETTVKELIRDAKTYN